MQGGSEGTGRRLLVATDDVRRRTDLLFAGFIMMAMTNLALLLLFGVSPLCDAVATCWSRGHP